MCPYTLLHWCELCDPFCSKKPPRNFNSTLVSLRPCLPNYFSRYLGKLNWNPRCLIVLIAILQRARLSLATWMTALILASDWLRLCEEKKCFVSCVLPDPYSVLFVPCCRYFQLLVLTSLFSNLGVTVARTGGSFMFRIKSLLSINFLFVFIWRGTNGQDVRLLVNTVGSKS